MQYRVVSQGYLGPDIYGDVYSPMKAENTQLQVKRMDRRQRDLLKLLLWKDNVTKIRRLKPVHTGDYSRRFRRQFVAENSDWRRKVRLSPNSATVAEFGDCRRCLAVFGDSRTFLRQCGQGFTETHQNSSKSRWQRINTKSCSNIVLHSFYSSRIVLPIVLPSEQTTALPAYIAVSFITFHSYLDWVCWLHAIYLHTKKSFR